MSGQLVPIRVRPSNVETGKFDLVYGHRRFLAAKKLGWKTINADVLSLDDQQILQQTLVENLQREDLSDFEKAIFFQRMASEFGKTYEQIGEYAGCSRQHVCNILAMLRLFEPAYILSHPDVLEELQSISEHHSRILARVQDPNERRNLLKIVISDNLSYKDLGQIVTRLRGWFEIAGDKSDSEIMVLKGSSRQKRAKQSQIEKVIHQKFRYARMGNFSGALSSELFDKDFTLYSLFPPFDMKEGYHAVTKLRNYFEKISPKLNCKLDNLKIQIVGAFALVTLTACYEGTFTDTSVNFRARGTMILVERDGIWKIFHEHWSNLDAPLDFSHQWSVQLTGPRLS